MNNMREQGCLVVLVIVLAVPVGWILISWIPPENSLRGPAAFFLLAALVFLMSAHWIHRSRNGPRNAK
jgi:uncharacterized membrane protein YfcA